MVGFKVNKHLGAEGTVTILDYVRQQGWRVDGEDKDVKPTYPFSLPQLLQTQIYEVLRGTFPSP